MSKNAFYLFANWKMYLDHAESVDLAHALKKEVSENSAQIHMTVFPMTLATVAVSEILKDTPVAVGAQNVHWVDKGGYTGEISSSMFKNVGCTYALVGHSERRHVFHESNSEVRKKLESLMSLGMTPVLCVGETLRERKENVTDAVIEAQIRAAYGDMVLAEEQEVFIAYEPVWSVSTGEACDPEEAERISARIVEWMESILPTAKPVVLYGGSVRPENVRGYFAGEHVSGVLVGGASTKLATWMDIVRAIQV